MSVENSFTYQIAKYAFYPVELTAKSLDSLYYHTCGKDIVVLSSAVSLYLLAQAVSSVVAISLQIISTLFICLYHLYQRDFEEVKNELVIGFKGTFLHLMAVPAAPIASIAVALCVIFTSPYTIYTWNTESKWWDLG